MTPSLNAFLAREGWAQATRTPLAGDASARRYLRLHDRARDRRAVVMLAPPEDRTSFEAFGAIARYLTDQGLSAPEIWAADPESGLMLIEDLGDDLMARKVAENPSTATALYTAACDLTTHLAGLTPPPALVTLTPHRMVEMIDITFESLEPVDDTETLRDRLAAALLSAFGAYLTGYETLILRDYHAENLIWLPDRAGLARVGLLDFQDAVFGPVGYDLISLLDDARRDVPEALKRQLIQRQATDLELEPDRFMLTCAILSVQRNLRILGVFSRLARTEGKTMYLRHIPRVAGHIRRAVDHPELADLRAPVIQLLDHWAAPA
ncbi:phosphotransferase [Roseobacter sp. HKCCD9010]|uniref:aminoglycoside phosphotransferase family protein n=1 Tax=unclassified Roseobacter TaxID=196798 RepID=UPI0014918096|nr:MULTISPECIES: phosphotransferase [unclassified Roseobacter]MBF9051090.1 phosphotransferase [Rhodobacterales bacterium HKCCD4356]NNV12859.1 phosphotransferase [Roseobacter sp. HKCCD7357]NNV16804.1 phosphotransferase [Roseobacter sp. HKCCD8768]NNV26564.1 phosphotransferase [Roseobacter sp. HKCCD8192]NNV30525.1 phosphotransferase [Roseobacter sp. HKCCD9061]